MRGRVEMYFFVFVEHLEFPSRIRDYALAFSIGQTTATIDNNSSFVEVVLLLLALSRFLIFKNLVDLNEYRQKNSLG